MARSTKTDSLSHLTLGQTLLILRKLQEHGVKPRHLRRLRNDADLAGRVAAILMGEEEVTRTEATRPGVSHDAVALLGFGPAGTEPLPEAAPGEVVIRYDGWSLQQLRNSPIVRAKSLVWDQDWYNKHAWSKEGVAAGVYRLRMRLPHSRKRTFDEQITLLREGEEAAPVCLVVTALLAHLVHTGEDLLKGDWSRCRERGSFGNRVSVRIAGGRLGVRYDYDEGRRDDLWLCSVQMVPCTLKLEPKNTLRLETDHPVTGVPDS